MGFGMFIGAGAAFHAPSRTNNIELFLYVSESIESAKARAQLILEERYPNCTYSVRFDPVGLVFLKDAVATLEGRDRTLITELRGEPLAQKSQAQR